MRSILASADEVAECRSKKRRRLNDPIGIQRRPPGGCFQTSDHCTLQILQLPDAHCDGDAALQAASEDEIGCDGPDRGSRSNDDGGMAVEDCYQTSPQKCCFGMLTNMPVRPRTNYIESSKSRAVIFEHPETLRTVDGHVKEGFKLINPTHLSILEQLEAAIEVETQLYCLGRAAGREQTTAQRRQRYVPSWSLNIILYGPPTLEDGIGQFLSQHKMYLQDPIGCERRVPYKNPHIIPPEDGDVVMTDSLDSPLGNLGVELLNVGPDLLAELVKCEEPLAETDSPDIVTTPLFSHQKQALTFMLQREQGWQLDGCRDVWTAQRDTFMRKIYINNVTGHVTGEAPPGFQGGLLADDMGLGKTLSMISLIAADIHGAGPLPTPPMTPENVVCTVKTTLLVVPPALIQSWQKQFRMHLKKKSLASYVFHGPKGKAIDNFGQYNVVITTYHTVSSLWRKRKGPGTSTDSLFSIDWHRIVLDEAHIIQNPQSDLAQACCALRSANRWAITGTPIQNKLSDFASIVKFLRVYPYCEQKTFDDHISRPWRRGDGQGFSRLQTLVRAITIARTKAVVDLPDRQDFIHHLDFSASELSLHEDAKKQTAALLHDAISSSGQARATFNALQRLNTLRLICSHGELAQSYLSMQNTTGTLDGSFTEVYPNIGCNDGVFESFVGGNYSCSQCGMDLLQDIVEDTSGPECLQPRFRTRPNLCLNCAIEVEDPPRSTFNFRGDTLMIDSPMSMGSSSDMVDHPSYPRELMPTKIKALVADLIQHSQAEKSVVFSYWTYTLDLVQAMLEDNGILYTRIDGKTSLPKRAQALRSFEKDNSLRVILVSITCGGAGLDLTAASRAYLMEPHWNPMIEEQALCRVHRVGQKRSVTTIRYLMRDSFEEQVVEIQKRKKLLAKVTFGQDPLEESGIGMSTLQYLKSVLE